MAALISVRQGTPEDATRAVEVFLAAESARRGGPVDRDEELRVGERIRSGNGWLMVAENGERIVGMAMCDDTRADDGTGEVIAGWCHLGLMFVSPELWGHGVGGLIMDGILEEARRQGYEHMQLWTHEDNSRGHRLYRSRGFVRSGRQKDDLRGQPIALWERRL